MKLAQLSEVDRRGRSSHQIERIGSLWKGDDLANRRFACEDGDQAVESECNAPVRGGAVLERVEEEAETKLRFLVRYTQPPEHPGLQPRVVDPDTAAAHFGTVQDQIVRLCTHSARIGFDLLEIDVQGRRKRVMHRVPTSVLLVVLEQREIGHPYKLEGVRTEQVLLFRQREPKLTEQLRRPVRRP